MNGLPGKPATNSNRLPVLAGEINRAHKAAREAAQTSLERAIEAGERLIEAKALVAHGQWLPWLKELCDLSERSAQVYMRLARHKDVTNTKSAAVADLTMRAAVAEITEPKWPDKLSEKFKAVRHLPFIGHIKIGLREDAAGWDEVWIAPSYQHNGFCYVTHAWTERSDGGTMLTGTKKPVRVDFVSTMIVEHLSYDLVGTDWFDIPFPPWTYNLLIFENAAAYINTFGLHDEEVIKDLAEIIESKAPSPNPAVFKAATRSSPEPICTLLIDGLAAGAS